MIVRSARELVSRGVSPVVSAVLLFIIALAAAGIALTIVSSRSGYVSSLLDALKVGTEKVLREDIQIVYTAANRNGKVVIGVMNTGPMPVRLLALYINGSPVSPSSVVIECREKKVNSFPVTISSGDLCLVTVSIEKKGRCYTVTIVTDEGSYDVRVYT